ncbi:LacI family DNA-binding transcriptional regulator [Streptomyces sp. NPDC058001]|uniref:LacI family DNA-binding transcriptional regulator n=1 Tax=Streptomyces sp. NPDC058001 TaxID=3346300 RepID=UPI0036F10B6F
MYVVEENLIMQRRVSIKDVAREAGVSIGTVSNTLNRPNLVSPSTRSRVQETIHALGFVRTEGARQLHGLPSPVVAVVVPQGADPFGAELTHEVEKVAAEISLGVMVHSDTPDDASRARYASFLAAQRVLGVVVAVETDTDQVLTALRDYGLPCVTAGEDHGASLGYAVHTDDVAGARTVVQHLLQLGHEFIAYLDGPATQRSRRRATGVAMALRAPGVAPRQELGLQAHALTVDAGREAARVLLGLRQRPTAVFCGDDRLALGVLQCLYEAGVSVPEDMALIGYGDSIHSATAAVPLTSVSRSVPEIARHAIRMLAVEGAPHLQDSADECAVVQPKLVVRRSSLRTVIHH